MTDLIERPSAYDWRSTSVADAAATPEQSDQIDRPSVTLIAATCVMVLALLAGATVAGIELVQAVAASSSELVRLR